MPTIVVQTPPTAAAEPVKLALLNAALRLDYDPVAIAAYEAGTATGLDPAVVAQLELLKVYRDAARQKVEAYTGRFFAPQTLAITYGLDEPYVLPAGATATAVTGFFTTLAALNDAAAYLVEYQKGISVNRQLSIATAALQTYTVTATTTGDPQYGALAKAAILELTGEWYRNRETTVAGVAVISELPVSWKVKLAQAVVQPLG
jgi:hypothetical protein